MSKLPIILGIFFIPLFLSCGHLFKRTIDPKTVDSIVLVQVRHPYLGGRIGSKKLPDSLYKNFVEDFANKHEEICKFYSCYIIKIYFKGGKFISYRTNGIAFEKFKDDEEKGGCFVLNEHVNLITKYWGIPEKEIYPSLK